MDVGSFFVWQDLGDGGFILYRKNAGKDGTINASVAVKRR